MLELNRDTLRGLLLGMTLAVAAFCLGKAEAQVSIDPASQSVPFLRTGTTLGPTAATGSIRIPHFGSIQARNQANSGDIPLMDWGNVSNNNLVVGGTSAHTRLATNLAAPGGTIADGHWWVECVGTSPARICAVKVQDAASTRTIASLTY